MTEVELCNKALLRLGCDPVSSPTGLVVDIVEDTVEAEACQALYAMIRDVVLEDRIWSFALNSDVLLGAAEYPVLEPVAAGGFYINNLDDPSALLGWSVLQLPDDGDTDATYGAEYDVVNGDQLVLNTTVTDDAWTTRPTPLQHVPAFTMLDYTLSFDTVSADEAEQTLMVLVLRGEVSSFDIDEVMDDPSTWYLMEVVDAYTAASHSFDFTASGPFTIAFLPGPPYGAPPP